MKAGRDLDRIISEYVLGYANVKQKNAGFVEATPLGTRPLAAYSKDMSAAWEVATAMAITLIPIEDGSWFAMAGKRGGWRSPAEFLQYLQTGEFSRSGAAVAETAPLAICLAAYAAMEKRRAQGIAPGENLPEPPGNLETH
jgi:hypothetical protein